MRPAACARIWTQAPVWRRLSPAEPLGIRKMGWGLRTRHASRQRALHLAAQQRGPTTGSAARAEPSNTALSARYNAADEPAARPYQRRYNCAGDSARYTGAGEMGWGLRTRHASRQRTLQRLGGIPKRRASRPTTEMRWGLRTRHASRQRALQRLGGGRRLGGSLALPTADEPAPRPYRRPGAEESVVMAARKRGPPNRRRSNPHERTVATNDTVRTRQRGVPTNDTERTLHIRQAQCRLREALQTATAASGDGRATSLVQPIRH
jgi:hypothetical protein